MKVTIDIEINTEEAIEIERLIRLQEVMFAADMVADWSMLHTLHVLDAIAKKYEGADKE